MLCLMIVFNNAVVGLRSPFLLLFSIMKGYHLSFNINPATQDRKSLAAFEFLVVLLTITV